MGARSNQYIRSGESAADIGCGPIGIVDLLSERVGATGSVVGLEREEHAKVIHSGVLTETQLSEHRAALIDHLKDPDTLLIDKLLVEAWGQK